MWGEDLAARWYRSHGYEAVARNWRCEFGEIDLIVARGDLIVIVEVKARASDRYGPPQSAVGSVKQRRLRRLAVAWLAQSEQHWPAVRFDVAAVTGVHIEVIEAAF